tara:strand:+ start:2745 stop:3401 length:657 start_codon:yes stop_codon:yes gene_type:complete
MKVLELFSGTRSVGKICDELGWDSYSVDLISDADFKGDVMDFDYRQFPKNTFDIVWASPPCTNYSKLQDGWLGRMRKGELYTKEVQEREMNEDDKLVSRTLEIINYFNCLWFIENPAGSRMKDRIMMKDLPNYIVDYCMYSDWGYRKRTRIWTNLKGFQAKTCDKNCGNMIGNLHKTNLGNTERKQKTKGIGTSQQDRYRIPPELVRDLFIEIISNDM